MANTEVFYPTQYDPLFSLSTSNNANQDNLLHVAQQVQQQQLSYQTSGGGRAELMSADDLAQRLSLQEDVPLILDCRSFIAYNAAHVSLAVNVNCADRLMRKRLLGGKVRLVDLVACPEGKRRLAEGNCTDVVAYDDDTVTLETTSACHQSSLLLILGLLVNLGKKVFYLEGGLKEFERRHGELCCRRTDEEKPQPQRPLCSPTSPVVEEGIDTAAVTEILPYLYLGNECDAADMDMLQRLCITHVLNVTSNIPFRCEHLGLVTKRLAASDSAMQDIRQYFTDALAFIDEAQRAGGRVLVHCQAGVSRSATIVIAYLMHQRGMTLMDAFHHVRSLRSIVAPNLSFMGQLLAFEQAMRKVVCAMTST